MLVRRHPLNILIFSIIIMCAWMSLVNNIHGQTNFTTIGQLEPPSDVTLKNYNTTEFILLLNNVTSNLTLAQTEIVMTRSSTLNAYIFIPIRVVIALVFDTLLFTCVFLLRNYEPLKSKLFISIILIALNVVSHIPGCMDLVPYIRVYFENYWNQFQLEKSQNPTLDASTFYRNNLNSKGIPTWMVNYITYENVWCFVSEYVIYGLIVASVSLYAIQLAKFILLNIVKNMRQSIVKNIEEFKRKQLEKRKNLKLKNVNESSSANLESLKDQSSQSMKTSPLTLDLSSVQSSASLESNSLSSRPLSARSSKKLIDSENNDSSNTLSDYDDFDIAMDFTSDDDATSNADIDEISKLGKLVNFLKRIIKYRVIEIGFVLLCLIIWYIFVSFQVARRQPDKWSTLFNNWDSNSGYCRYSDRSSIFNFDLILTCAIFLMIPVLLVIDFIISVNNYLKYRQNMKERGEKVSNFFIYYFSESDPFVYRLESIVLISIDAICILLFLIMNSIPGQAAYFILNFFLVFGLNFIGGPGANPGITILKTMWNYYNSYKSRKAQSNKQEMKDKPTIQNVQQLDSSPVSSSSIDFILSHKKERDLFYQYLKEEYSIENLLFYEDLKILRKINERNVRAKIAKIKEMVKLYMCSGDSIFEINVPTKVINIELKDYRELLLLLEKEKIKVNQLPKRIVKDSQTRYFPNIDLSREEVMRPLLENLCKPTIFSLLSFEIYKNLLDSFYRFQNSRKWKEYIKSVTKQSFSDP